MPGDNIPWYHGSLAYRLVKRSHSSAEFRKLTWYPLIADFQIREIQYVDFVTVRISILAHYISRRRA